MPIEPTQLEFRYTGSGSSSSPQDSLGNDEMSESEYSLSISPERSIYLQDSHSSIKLTGTSRGLNSIIDLKLLKEDGSTGHVRG